ncbi:hypothetical protein HYZ97_04815 [Candidatus Pacearchaeota archaeon]|nr:hypothetical protein [Candidatus Pacearchaeota archaeon]
MEGEEEFYKRVRAYVQREEERLRREYPGEFMAIGENPEGQLYEIAHDWNPAKVMDMTLVTHRRRHFSAGFIENLLGEPTKDMLILPYNPIRR